MDIGWIDDLIALEDHGTLARAAAARHVTQPAFSRRIAAIEGWCGASLVDRSRRPLRLRPEARALLPDLRAAASAMHQLRQDLRRSQAEGARLVIAAQHSLAISLMPRLYSRIAESMPTATLRLRSSNRADGLVLLLTGVADVLICHETERHPLELGAVDAERLCLDHDTLVPVTGNPEFAARVAHALQKGERLDLPCVTYPTDAFLGRVLQDEGLVRLPPQFSFVRLIETALTPAVAGLLEGRALAGWLPLSMVAAAGPARGLHRLPAELGEIVLTISAVRMRSRANAATAKLWDSLDGVCRA